MTKIFRLFPKRDIFLLALLSVSSPLFFYKLGQTSLVSWDEAWYGAIAKNIISSGNILYLTFNGNRYLDHPPAGFWLMALSMKLFGIGEFWVRFPSALSGLLSIYIIYLLGKELFNRVVGFSSAVALSSAIWFVYRARSGNLDSLLTLFFLTTLYLAIKASKNRRFLIPFAVSLSLLFLTKTVVPFTILPALLVIFYKEKIKFKEFFKPILIFLFLFGGWILAQWIKYPDFINRYLSIGLPGVEVKTSYLDNLKQIKEYLHSGVGKWFWPGLASIILSLGFLQKRFLILTVFFVTFFLPFIFSSRGSIWHLVPLHPILILSFFGFIYVTLERIINMKIFKNLRIRGNKFLLIVPMLLVSFYFSFMQIKLIWYQFIDIPAYVSDEAILSKVAGEFTNKQFVIDGDFVPAAVYYSGKNVSQLWGGGMKDLFASKQDFILITKQYRLDQALIAKNDYQILKQDRDKILIIRNNQ